MELWVRSQDKGLLMKTPELRYKQKGNVHSLLAYDISGGYRILGVYKSKERAIEILDEIQDYMKKCLFAKKVNGLGEELDLIPNPILIYQMPKD